MNKVFTIRNKTIKTKQNLEDLEKLMIKAIPKSFTKKIQLKAVLKELMSKKSYRK